MNTKSNDTVNALDATKDVWNEMTFGGLVHSLRLSDELTQVELAKRVGFLSNFLVM